MFDLRYDNLKTTIFRNMEGVPNNKVRMDSSKHYAIIANHCRFKSSVIFQAPVL
jgi:hypothetical protein